MRIIDCGALIYFHLYFIISPTYAPIIEFFACSLVCVSRCPQESGKMWVLRIPWYLPCAVLA